MGKLPRHFHFLFSERYPNPSDSSYQAPPLGVDSFVLDPVRSIWPNDMFPICCLGFIFVMHFVMDERRINGRLQGCDVNNGRASPMMVNESLYNNTITVETSNLRQISDR